MNVLSLAMRKDVRTRALYICVVVGVILNGINQGHALLAGQAPDLIRMVLTFMVPYCVSTYSSVTTILKYESG